MQSPEEKLKQINSPKEDREQVPDRYTFEIDIKDSRGKQYRGSFTTKAPTIADLINIGRLKASYLPEGAVDDPAAAGFNHMVCHLAVVLVSKPTWWVPHQFYSAEPLLAVHKEVTAYETRFLGHGQGSRAGSEDDSGQGSGPEMDRESDLEPEVQSAPERSETIISNRKGGPGTDR